MGMIVFKAFLWVVLLTALWSIFTGFIKAIIWGCTYTRDTIGSYRDEKAYAPIRAARLKAADDSLRAAINRANAFLEQEKNS
ncbi:hypothetical protein Ahp2_56 [Aeromonas phage Ahp2]|nr:hypothetical protein Ahp2_56 [Aeromonas phage Ahp2]